MRGKYTLRFIPFPILMVSVIIFNKPITVEHTLSAKGEKIDERNDDSKGKMAGGTAEKISGQDSYGLLGDTRGQ